MGTDVLRWAEELARRPASEDELREIMRAALPHRGDPAVTRPIISAAERVFSACEVESAMVRVGWYSHSLTSPPPQAA